ncbi:MAG: TetR/AcrR family transcriptional regulator [Burkholderiales bacterium]
MTGKEAVRVRDPDRTVEDIIAVATEEFARKGLAGARVDEIAERMRTSKRTIYYYFGGKEALYLAVLEAAYRRARKIDSPDALDHLEPSAALTELVGRTFDFQAANEDYVRLVMNENVQRAEFLKQIKDMRGLNAPAIEALRSIYERGVKAGAFRRGLDPIDIHQTISSLAFFNVSNRYTFAHLFDRDMTSAAAHARRRASVIETVLRFVKV